MPSTRQTEIKSVLFVCSANQCRSPMAEVLFKDMLSALGEEDQWRVESAGAWARPGSPATHTAIHAMADREIDLDDHQSQPVAEGLLEDFNLILCMELAHKRFIQRNFPAVRGRTFLLSEMSGMEKEIWDPVGMSLETYNNTADEMLEIIDAGFEKMKRLASSPK